jgi:hypothetical protein
VRRLRTGVLTSSVLFVRQSRRVRVSGVAADTKMAEELNGLEWWRSSQLGSECKLRHLGPERAAAAEDAPSDSRPPPAHGRRPARGAAAAGRPTPPSIGEERTREVSRLHALLASVRPHDVVGKARKRASGSGILTA